MRFVSRIGVHSSEYDDTKHAIYAPDEIALNHYAIMSKEYFKKVKMTRGDVATNQWNTIRDWNYFADYDNNEVEDNELVNLLE